MHESSHCQNRRILVIDDNRSIHDDFRKILSPADATAAALDASEAAVFGDAPAAARPSGFQIDSAYQGQEGLLRVQKAAAAALPYALAFVDMRMPPGWDGVETARRIWEADPHVQIVLCTAYSDYSWDEMVENLGHSDSLLILKKPFDTVEALQLAYALTEKWRLYQASREKLSELTAANAALAREIGEHKQTEMELVKSFRAADEANHAKSAFLARMSHEIRTPMNGIIGMTHLLQQTALTLKQTGYSTKIAFAAQNLMGIINDILDFSKIEAGKMELEQVAFDLEEVLARMVEVTSVQARRKSLECTISIAANTPMMLIGDPLRLGQVLTNLMSNAIKFTERGEVAVAVSPLERNDADVVMKFEVRDSGIGIEPGNISKLFQPFSQSDTSTTRRFGGTGLGLVIAKRFVQLMGGDISIRSQPGRGSTFSFTARFRLDPNHKIGSGTLPSAKFRRQALVIDSDPTSRIQLSRLLAELSFDAFGADSCQSAVRELTRLDEAGMQRFDVALMDCSDPDEIRMEDALRVQRECGDIALPPFILVASREASDLRIQLEDIGFDGFVIKPTTRSSLFDAAQRALVKKSKTGIDSANSEAAAGALRGARILLVEDNDINQQIATEILRLAGCLVTAATNGHDALSILTGPASSGVDSKFSAVLMDIQMPGLDGCAATRLIRADKRHEKLPIIAMTADALSGVREKCLDAGMNGYLTKPVNPDELYAMLKKWIAV